MRDSSEQNLAQTLKGHRLHAGLTQEDLAERSGISGRTISDVERGLRSKVYPATARRLASALDLGEEERRRFLALVARPSQGQKPAPELRLPIPPTPLVGRSRELQIVTEAIAGDAYSLITLTGPGGVGKTRLALEAAHLTASRFPEGVFFVSLGELTRPSLVPIAMARALGVVDAGKDPETLIAVRLSQGRALILLDTFEHVLGAASSVHSLLLRCPEVTFLITSRTALRLRAEQEFQIPPLELPPAGGGARKPSVETWPATSLFLQRALAVKPDLSIDDESSRLIAAICHRLEGLPLAIELACSRLRHLPLKALHDQLDYRLQLLVRGATDFPPRQRTMRNTLAWSHDLLTPEEQILFRRLSVFAGGWDLDAISPVCEAAYGTLEVLSSLVDKSLIYLSGNGGAARYDMLDVVREYGAECLSKADETGAFSDRHAEHYLALAEEAETGLVTANQNSWIARLEREHNNLRKALGWLIEGGDTRALRFVVALWRYWRHSGQLIEGRRWCESAIALPGDSPSSLRARACWAAAALAFPQGDYQRMSELASSSLAFALESEDPMNLRNAHTLVGLVAMVEGRYRDALEPLHLALSFCRNLGPSWQLATSHLNLGLALLHSGDLHNAGITLSNGLRSYVELGDETFAARSRVALSHLALLSGNVAEAEALARAALSAFASTKERQGLAEALVTMAAIRAVRGEIQVAGELHGAATALRETIAARPAPFDDEIPNRFFDKAQAENSSTWLAAWSGGRGLTLEAALKRALGRQATMAHDPLSGRS